MARFRQGRLPFDELPRDAARAVEARRDGRSVRIELIVTRFTALAVMVRQTELSAEVSLPLSLVGVDAGASGVTWIQMPEWLAVEKGLA
jgi:hypothetical protein